MTKEIIGNPYVVGPPVSGGNLYGRQEVFQFINESLASSTNRLMVLHGQRRVGKSSILHELHLHRLSPAEYCTVRIDVQGQAKTPFTIAIHDLATHIAERLEIEEPDLANYQEDDSYFEQVFLPEVLAQLAQRRLIIMIDEFDALANDEPVKDTAGTKFVPLLQNILDDDKFKQIIFVLVIGRSLDKLPPDYTHLIKIGRFNRIWLLSREDTETLVTQPAADKLTFEPGAIEGIWHYTSGHPYFTQLLCHEVFNRAKRRQNPVVKANDVDQIIGAALETGQPAFVWLWDALSIAERLLISAVGSATTNEEVADKEKILNILKENRVRLGNVDLVEAANHLVGERVLQLQGDDAYRFEVELVGLWVKENHSIKQEKLNIAEMSRSATSYYNVARRSHDRGKLEAAIEGYRLALQDNPNHFNAQLGLAQALWDQGDIEEAMEEFEDAYWLNEEDSKAGLVGARMALAESLETQEKFIEASVHYRRVLELVPDYRPLQEKLKVLYDKGEQAARNKETLPLAIDFFDRLIEIDANYENAHEKLLETLYQQGQMFENTETWSKAVQTYERIIEFDPHYKDAVQRKTDCTNKAKQPLPGPALSMPIIVGVIVVVFLIIGGSAGGWFIWNSQVAQATPTTTSTAAIIVQVTTPSVIEPTEENTPTPTHTPTTPAPQATPSKPAETEEPTEEPTTRPTGEATTEPTPIIIVVTETPTIIPTEESTTEPTEEPTTEPNPLPTGEALDVDMNPQNPQELFALLNGSIHRTQDGGNAWEEIGPSASSLTILVIAPNNPAYIYVGGFGQIIKSTDSGNSWKNLSSPGQVQILDLAIPENNSDTIYAATDGGILISQDGGQTWDNGRSNGAALITPFYAIAVGKNGIAYAAGEGDVIYRSSGAGTDWRSFVCSSCDSAIYSLAVKGNTVFAGGISANLSRSDDQGENWQSSNQNIPTAQVPTLNISKIILSSDEQAIYAGTGFRATNDNGLGIYKSTDNGYTWTHLPLPPGAGNTYHVQSVTVDPQNPRTIYIAGFGGIHKSVDGGQTWIKQ